MADSAGSREPPRFSDGVPAITVLHVSDIQFGKHHRFQDPSGGFDTLLRGLCDDLDLLASDHGLRPDLVALTGDLAEWGMAAEFEQVAVFSEGLRKHLKLEPERLLVIPGNHDINRKLCASYFLHCEGRGKVPKPPYWPKWEPFVDLFARLYRDVDRYRFTELEPWTLFEIPSLRVVLAGLNSTMIESHRDSDHYGHVSKEQLRWFDTRLAEYEHRGWLRIGLVHHNAVRRAGTDDENLKDADDLREILGDRLHLLLHGHTHQGRVEMLGPSLPVLSTGSAAVNRDQRPGPLPDQPGETPNQYQLLRLTRTGLWHAAREYTYERKRWIGDTRVSRRGDGWWHSIDHTWAKVDGTFPLTSAGARRRATEHADISHEEDSLGRAIVERGREDDLLDDVISWCQIRGEGKPAEVTRIRYRGPWGDYAKIHDRERGTGLLGAYRGGFTAEVLERWVADVHAPFRGRGQSVSKLVIATTTIDPGLRSEAQARGVDVERMIDYQRVLDTVGYREKLHERLARDREYPSEYYIEQQMTVWSPIQPASERVERAADWLATRLLEREGAFALVLGPAGVGKTFLLREVARRLGRQQAITPILVELRDLERAHTIEELAATQFTRFGVPWHPKAFRRDLEEGRLALLFDGFDELALRVRSAAIPAHFERIYNAAVDRARIAVSSRTEHFLSSGEVADLMTPSSARATSLGGMLERVQRRHVLEVHPFEREDVAAYLRRRLDDGPGEARLARLSRVHDLIGLARNPRMLGFLVDIPDDQFAQAARTGTSITSDALYRVVVEDAWLTEEARRMNPEGAAPGPDAKALHDAATHLALQLWRDPSGSVQAEDVGLHIGSLLARMCDDDPEWATHTARVRTLLTRDDRGRIRFIHQTVLEWLVVGRLAMELAGTSPGTHLEVGRLNAFMIDLLRERLGDTVMAEWAEARLASPSTSTAIENARDILKWMNREAAVQAIHRNQDLRGQDLGGQSLRHAILDGADLTGQRMVGRDLTGASLVATQLAYADFTDACLRDADLTAANLAFARFHRADLLDACLINAQLTGASLIGARVSSPLDQLSAIGIALQVPAVIEAACARPMSRSGHIAINAAGTLLASVHGDETVRLWNYATGQLVRILPMPGVSPLSVVFSRDGRTLASGVTDGTVRLWNTGDGREQRRLVGHGPRVWSVAFSPDSKMLASGAADGTLRLWNIMDGSEVFRQAGLGARVSSVAFSPSGDLIVSGGSDGVVRLWDRTGATNGRLYQRSHIWSVAISPDGSTLASGSEDGTVQLWDLTTMSQQRRLCGNRAAFWSLAFSPDGQTLAGGQRNVIWLWNVSDGSERTRLSCDGRGVAFSPDGKTVVTGSDDGIRSWDLGESRGPSRWAIHGNSVWSVTFSVDGGTVASGAGDGIVRLWSVRQGEETLRLAQHNGPILSVAFSADGTTIATGSADCTVRLWNAATGSEQAQLSGHTKSVYCVAITPDSATVASGSGDGTIGLWNAHSGHLQRRLGVGASVGCVAFSTTGNTLVSASEDGAVRLWDVHHEIAGVPLARHDGAVFSVAFSHDDRMIVSASADKTVRLWDLINMRERARLRGNSDRVQSVAFSPDATLIASGGEDGTVRLWDATTGASRGVLGQHGGTAWDVAFSPDGKMLASAARDATVRLWDIATQQCLAILYGTASGTVAMRPDGRYRVRGDVAGSFWHVIGLHRYDIGELDALVPGLRLAEDEPLIARS
ncbi:MAG TPA: pentapeptide repeat-containing protein [Kofleriaceae bacterium]